MALGVPARVALIALKEDDFGVDANLQFCHHGPRVPRSLFRRAVGGVPQTLTRAKVAELVDALDVCSDVSHTARFESCTHPPHRPPSPSPRGNSRP